MKIGGDFWLRTVRHDARAANRDGSVLDNAPPGVHGDDVAGAPDPVDWLRPDAGYEYEKTTKKTHRKASGTDLSAAMIRACPAGWSKSLRYRRRIPIDSDGTL